MINLVSNDDVTFSVYGRALVRDSKRFLLQSKYQSLDSTIRPFSATILSYYVDFINEGSVTLDKQYETELLSLADYMVSVRFEHEVKWQLMYEDIFRDYLVNGEHEYGIGVLYSIFGVVQNDPESALKAVSAFILDKKINYGINVTDELDDELKIHQFYRLYSKNDLLKRINNNDVLLSLDIKYLTSVNLFESVYGSLEEIDKMWEQCDINKVNELLKQKQIDYESKH